MRFKELDSIRGIAAFIVMIYHVLLFNSIFLVNTYGNDDYWLINLVKYSPLRVLFAGDEAVLMFFILSGFVLSLAFLQSNKIHYSSYIVKRFCRLYIPFIVSIGLSIFVCVIFSRGGVNGFETGHMYLSNIDLKLILEHIFMIGEYDAYALNPPIWSLVHEMRISLIFPFVMILVVKYGWKRLIPFALLLTVGGELFWIVNPGESWTQKAVSYSMSIQYLGFFVLGAMLAKYRDQLMRVFNNFNTILKILIGICGILLITYRWWFFYDAPLIHIGIVNNWIISIGVAIIIISSLSFVKISRFLLKKPFVVLGKISYSLYLVHMIIAFIVIKTLGDKLPFAVIGILIITLSLISAYVFYTTVEESSIKLGKYFSGKLKKSSHKKMNLIQKLN